MSSWRDNLREASFRGVSFWFAESAHSTGRRLQSHVYPGRDVPYTEDLGRKVREWTIEAFVFGVSYMAHRDRLIDALEEEGAAEFVHPREGAIWVRVGSVSISESTSDGGYAKFSITFVEAGQRELPGETTDTAATVTIDGDALLEEIENELGGLNLDNALSIEQAISTIQGGLSELRRINGEIDAALAPVSELANTIDELGNEVATLINQPAELVSSVSGVMFSIYGAFNDVASAFKIYSDLDDSFTFPDVAPNTTPANVATNANQALLSTAFRSLNTVNAAKAIVSQSRAVDASADESPFNNYDEVISVRDALLLSLDETADTASFTLFESIQSLKLSFNTHLNNHGMRLPRVRRYKLAEVRPLLAIAYDLTGSALQADDLKSRNQISHPLFVTAGSEVEYLQ